MAQDAVNRRSLVSAVSNVTVALQELVSESVSRFANIRVIHSFSLDKLNREVSGQDRARLGEPEGKRPLWKPRRRRKDIIEMDVQK
jgi:hypothetical protein